MDSRERYIRALTFSGPDRVPVMHCALKGAWLAHGHGLEDLYARYPSDVLLSSRTRGPFAFAGSERGHWADGAVTVDDWGVGWLWNTPEYMGQAMHHPLADRDALAAWRPPDPMTGAAGVALMEREVTADGHRHFVFVDGGEVFQRLLFLRGMEALMIRPAVWRRVFRPAYARLIDAIHDVGAYVSFHSDGVIDAILPDLVELGVDEVNPQAHVMNIEDLVRRLGGMVCVRADIDRQYAMPHGTPAEGRALIRRLYAAFGSPNGGYAGWAEMSSDVPLANGEAALGAFYELGSGCPVAPAPAPTRRR